MNQSMASLDPDMQEDASMTKEDTLSRLVRMYGHLKGPELLRAMIKTEFAGRIAVTSSFGAEAAVMLHMVARIDPDTPVIFLDTGHLFSTTISYQEIIQTRLRLGDVRVIRPDQKDIARNDPDGTLWRDDPDACCHFRKVVPLEKALAGFDAWITGRKRFHGNERTNLPTIEFVDGRVKINPLVGWSPEDVEAAFRKYDLPRHPLADTGGYTSIGCHTCTYKSAPGDGARSGRWAGTGKTECGIHRSSSTWAGENI